MKKYLKLLIIVICFILVYKVISYSTGGAPSEFGNDSLSTCYVGGDLGVINCTGNIKTTDGNVTGNNFLNSSGDLEWIKPENIFDVDDEDIESDLNTYVDIGGDKMTGNLSIPGLNITQLINCNTIDTDSDGVLSCGTDDITSSGNQILSFSGVSFQSSIANRSFLNDETAERTVSQSTTDFISPINLPNGSTITGGIFYGNAGAKNEVWRISSFSFSSFGFSDILSANVNSSDSSPTLTIDNLNNAYFVKIQALDLNDIIYGGYINYTT